MRGRRRGGRHGGHRRIARGGRDEYGAVCVACEHLLSICEDLRSLSEDMK